MTAWLRDQPGLTPHIRPEAGIEPACKPDSVPVARGRPSIYAAYLRHRTGRPSSLSGVAPGRACLATAVTRGTGGLLHRRFTLTRPEPGGLLSVALSRGSPRVAVSDCRALRSPDFPRCQDNTAAVRPARRAFDQIRTGALLLTVQLLYRWSYEGVCCCLAAAEYLGQPLLGAQGSNLEKTRGQNPPGLPVPLPPISVRGGT